MRAIPCPGCGQQIPEFELTPAKRIECEHCAGLVLEVETGGGALVLRQVHFASCPACDARLEVPRDAVAGQEMRHCGRTFRLTYESGAWALE